MFITKIVLVIVIFYGCLLLTNPLEALNIRDQLLAKGEHKFLAECVARLAEFGIFASAFVIANWLWRGLTALTL